MDKNIEEIVSNIISEKSELDSQDQRRLKGVLDNFLMGYKNLLKVWEELNDSGELGSTDYPFDKSFDELDVDKWVKTFKSEIDKN